MNETTLLKFNRDTSIYASEDREWNTLFLRSNLCYMQDLLKSRGYIYLNQIYELLGIAWNPEQNNRCYVNDDHIEFGIIFVNDPAVVIEHKH